MTQYYEGIPSTTWFLRHVAAALERSPEGFLLDLDSAASALGLGHRHGRHSPFMRAIERACQFGIARRDAGEPEVLAVRRRIAPLTQGQLRRLPEHLQRDHRELQEAELHDGDELDTRRARRLALALLEVGDRPDEAEARLGQWAIRPDRAREAVQWAHRRHANARAAVGGDAA